MKMNRVMFWKDLCFCQRQIKIILYYIIIIFKKCYDMKCSGKITFFFFPNREEQVVKKSSRKRGMV